MIVNMICRAIRTWWLLVLLIWRLIKRDDIFIINDMSKRFVKTNNVRTYASLLTVLYYKSIACISLRYTFCKLVTLKGFSIFYSVCTIQHSSLEGNTIPTTEYWLNETHFLMTYFLPIRHLWIDFRFRKNISWHNATFDILIFAK